MLPLCVFLMVLGNLLPRITRRGYRPRPRPRLPLARQRGRLISKPKRVSVHLPHHHLRSCPSPLHGGRHVLSSLYSVTKPLGNGPTCRHVPSLRKTLENLQHFFSDRNRDSRRFCRGGKLFVHVQQSAASCCKTQHLFIRRAISSVGKFHNTPRELHHALRELRGRWRRSHRPEIEPASTWGDAPYPVTRDRPAAPQPQSALDCGRTQ